MKRKEVAMLDFAEEKVMEALERAANCNDPEVAHGMADGALVEFVQALGYESVVAAYEAVEPKWYA